MEKREGHRYHQMTAGDVPVDSKEGIECLFTWARYHGFVLDEAHERIAKKHGVSTDGVIIRRQIPIGKQKRKPTNGN